MGSALPHGPFKCGDRCQVVYGDVMVRYDGPVGREQRIEVRRRDVEWSSGTGWIRVP